VIGMRTVTACDDPAATSGDGRKAGRLLIVSRRVPFAVACALSELKRTRQLRFEGRDVRGLPLLRRKRLLRSVMPRVESRLLYLDSIAERGRDLYRAACDKDLEGIVAKWTGGRYLSDGRGPSWLKIKNQRGA
jgi:hypothetical protein